MNSKQGLPGRFAFIVGTFLLIDGIWGMFSTQTYIIFTTNKLHASSHIALGLLGIYTGLTQHARTWCLLYGPTVLLVGILRFVPGIGEFVYSVFNINYAISVFNIIAGTIAIVIARTPQAINAR